MSQFTPDHAQAQELLTAAGLPQSAAETHGILCGMLCADVKEWRPALLEEADTEAEVSREAMDLLEKLWQTANAELQERRMPLQLLLPDDDHPLPERARAIRDWCQGFLYGFGLGGRQKPERFQGEAGEALQDFSEIARMDLDDFSDDHGAEEALMQLQEYLWVATSLLWHEMQEQHDAQ